MLHFEIFDREYLKNTPVTGVTVPSDLNYLRRLYTFNRDSIENYYLDRNFVVKNTHILSRFLTHLAPHFTYEPLRYIEYVDNKLTYLAKHFKFTSDIEKGLVHPPHFFGNEGEEVVMIEYEPFDVEKVIANWKTEPCLKIVTHPRNDTKLLLPLGNNDESRGGLAVIALDPLKLALKYREFLREQYFREARGENTYNKNHFVIKYVLSTTVEDSVDHMFFNKVMDRFYGREEVTPKFRHKFKLYEPTKQIDRYVDQTLNTITSKKLDFVNTMNNIQLIFKISSIDLLATPDLSGTRQSRWSLVVSRLAYMCFLYDVSKDKGVNKHVINDWKKLMKRMKRDRGMLGEFGYELSKELEDYIYKIENI